MTDRELLKLAANAAGMQWIDNCRSGLTIQRPEGSGIYNFHWNPLYDDGDAQRLAVKLGFCVTVFYNQGDVWVGYAAGNVGGNHVELLGDDPYAATRRAIVEAAAIVGAAMAAPV